MLYSLFMSCNHSLSLTRGTISVYTHFLFPLLKFIIIGKRVKEYFHDKVAKARRAGLNEKTVLNYFIAGMNDEGMTTALSTREYESAHGLLQSFLKI